MTTWAETASSPASVPALDIEHVVEMNNLQAAWRDVRANHGGPGANAITLARFERHLELNLSQLATSVRDDTYRPGPIRRVRVVLGTKTRYLSILTVADRVLQRAALNVLGPHFDRTFLARSYGYRPGRSLTDAIRRVLTLRDQGYLWVVDADVKDCFSNIDHEILLAMLAPRLRAPRLLGLVRQWIAMDGRRVGGRVRGLSLGAIVSPLFCNVYLHPLDRALARAHLASVRYADDFVVLCSNEAQRSFAVEVVDKQLRALRLELNRQKTRLTTFRDGFTFLGVTFRGDHCACELAGHRLRFEELPPGWRSVFPNAYR